MTADEIHKFQQKIGKLTQWTGQPYEKQVNQMLADMYREVGGRLT